MNGGPYGENGFLEDYTARVRGEQIGNVVLVSRNAAGQAQHIVANYRPRSTLLLLSRLLGEHFAGTPTASTSPPASSDDGPMGVHLQPCSISGTTVRILDTADSPATAVSGFFPLVNGSTMDFSRPFGMTYPSPPSRPATRLRKSSSAS